jgi:hypothetical protein
MELENYNRRKLPAKDTHLLIHTECDRVRFQDNDKLRLHTELKLLISQPCDMKTSLDYLVGFNEISPKEIGNQEVSVRETRKTEIVTAESF